jgi:hypothetical protein
MSPKRLVISTSYKTRVALENPCKKHQGIVIGQLRDRRVSKHSNSGSGSGCRATSGHPAADHRCQKSDVTAVTGAPRILREFFSLHGHDSFEIEHQCSPIESAVPSDHLATGTRNTVSRS